MRSQMRSHLQDIRPPTHRLEARVAIVAVPRAKQPKTRHRRNVDQTPHRLWNPGRYRRHHLEGPLKSGRGSHRSEHWSVSDKVSDTSAFLSTLWSLGRWRGIANLVLTGPDLWLLPQYRHSLYQVCPVPRRLLGDVAFGGTPADVSLGSHGL